MFKRTHTCGELNSKENIGDLISLCGWISKSRDLGGLHFIDLRDRYGKTQIVFNQEINKDAFETVKKLGEFNCILANTIKGKGCSLMENKKNWHYYNLLSKDEIKQVREELS